MDLEGFGRIRSLLHCWDCTLSFHTTWVDREFGFCTAQNKAFFYRFQSWLASFYVIPLYSF